MCVDPPSPSVDPLTSASQGSRASNSGGGGCNREGRLLDLPPMRTGVDDGVGSRGIEVTDDGRSERIH